MKRSLKKTNCFSEKVFDLFKDVGGIGMFGGSSPRISPALAHQATTIIPTVTATRPNKRSTATNCTRSLP